MRILAIAMALISILCGCGPARPSKSAPAPLLVAVASDLQTVMPRLIARFEVLEGVKVEPTFGASGQFAQQLKQGAPYDLFFSANRKFVSDLADQGILKPETVKDYARGSLVLVVGAAVPASITTLADLTDPSVKKIAIANPDTAPYGTAARQTLETSNLWDILEPKRVQAETVRQALQFVQTENAEAGLVGKAIADVPGIRSYPIDDNLYAPLWQACAVNARSQQPDHALAFLRFVTEGEGKSLLREAGFSVDSGK